MNKIKHYLNYLWTGFLIPFLQRGAYTYLATFVAIRQELGIEWKYLRGLLLWDCFEKRAEDVMIKDGLIYSIIKNEMNEYTRLPASAQKLLQRYWYCGYVRFPECPFIVANPKYDMDDFKNGVEIVSRLADYIPVHGGITWEKPDTYGYLFGFDCNHYRDESNPILQNKEWLFNEINNMRCSIEFAIKEGFEQRYIFAKDNEEKALILDEFHDELQKKGIVFDLSESYQSMMNLLTGRL